VHGQVPLIEGHAYLDRHGLCAHVVPLRDKDGHMTCGRPRSAHARQGK
jgi:hypothetical protein